MGLSFFTAARISLLWGSVFVPQLECFIAGFSCRIAATTSAPWGSCGLTTAARVSVVLGLAAAVCTPGAARVGGGAGIYRAPLGWVASLCITWFIQVRGGI